MNFLATLRVALNALRVNKLRSALTMLGIIIGVAAVIVMIAIGSGAQAKVEEQIRSLGSNLIIVFSASATYTGARSAAGSLQTLITDPMLAEVSGVGGVLIIAISLNMLKLTKIKLANLLPGLPLAVLLVWLGWF